MKVGDLVLISMRLLLFITGFVTNSGASKIRHVYVEENKPATLYCDINNAKGYSLTNYKWLQLDWMLESEWIERNFSTISHMNETYVVMTLDIANVTIKVWDFSYKCSADTNHIETHIESSEYRLYTSDPDKLYMYARAVGTDRIYLKVDVNRVKATTLDFVVDGRHFFVIEYLVNGTTRWQYATTDYTTSDFPIDYVIHGLQPGTTYVIKSTNSRVPSAAMEEFKWVTTLQRDIEYVPVITVVKVTDDTVAIEWTAPPPELEGYISDYRASIKCQILRVDTMDKMGKRTSALTYVFKGFFIFEECAFKVEACSIDECRNKYIGTLKKEFLHLEDGINPTFTPAVSTNGSTNDSITISWTTPQYSYKGPAIHYYRLEVIVSHNLTDQLVFVNGTTNSYRFENLLQNIEYRIQVTACGMYRMNCGKASVPIKTHTSGNPELVRNTQDDRYTIVAGIWLIASALIFIIVMSVFAAWKLRKESLKRKLIKARLEYFNNGTSFILNPEVAVNDQAELLPYLKKYEFPRSLLTLGDILGSGAFGVVKRGQAKTICGREDVTTVAVKTVRATASLDCMTALLRELRILCYLGEHLNLVSLLGACTKNLEYGQLFVIVEFCRFGNLHDYLLRHRRGFVDQLDADTIEIRNKNQLEDMLQVNDQGTESEARCNRDLELEESSDSSDPSCAGVTVDGVENEAESGDPKLPSKYPGDYTEIHTDPLRTRDLVCWAWQISRGMQYLSAKKILHGDLAARNILLSDNSIVKICDFGLSKSLRDEENFKNNERGPMPVKWMAIESLRDRVFSTKSDVWSYGVVLWELFSLGNTPYYGIRPHDMCQTLIGGYRMERPKYAPQSLHDIMLRCWKEDPSERPSFELLSWKVGDMIDQHVKSYYLDLGNPYTEMYADAWKREREIMVHDDDTPIYEDTRL